MERRGLAMASVGKRYLKFTIVGKRWQKSRKHLFALQRAIYTHTWKVCVCGWYGPSRLGYASNLMVHGGGSLEHAHNMP